MILYAIRQKSTGFFIPVTHRLSRTGASSQPKEDCIPRLFKRKSDARYALNMWLMGQWYSHKDGGLEYNKDSSRKPEDMEIIQVTLNDTQTK